MVLSGIIQPAMNSEGSIDSSSDWDCLRNLWTPKFNLALKDSCDLGIAHVRFPFSAFRKIIFNDQYAFRLAQSKFHPNDIFRSLSVPSLQNENTILQDANLESAVVDALNVILRTDPKYFFWVATVTNYLIITQVDDGISYSGSSREFCGLVHISLPISENQFAETLVHEASHQHFYLAELFGKTTNCGDDFLVFSPVTSSKRPLFALLMAFHAFANICCYSETYARSEGISLPNLESIDLNREKALSLLDPLEANKRYFTTSGLALYEPLKARFLAAR